MAIFFCCAAFHGKVAIRYRQGVVQLVHCFLPHKYAVGHHHYRYNNHIYQLASFTFPAVSSIQMPILMIPVSIVLIGVVFMPL